MGWRPISSAQATGFALQRNISPARAFIKSMHGFFFRARYTLDYSARQPLKDKITHTELSFGDADNGDVKKFREQSRES